MRRSASRTRSTPSCCQGQLQCISLLFAPSILLGEFIDYFTDQDWKDAKPSDWAFFSLFLVITSASCIGVHRYFINTIKKSDTSKTTLFIAPQLPVFIYTLCNIIKLIAEWLIEGKDAQEEFGQDNLQNAILASLKQTGFLITVGLMLSTQVANVLFDGTVWRMTLSALGLYKDNTQRIINGDEALEDPLLNDSGSYSSRSGDSSILSRQPSSFQSA